MASSCGRSDGFVDEWRHFGRPSGITILADDTLLVADSESGVPIPGPPGSGRARKLAPQSEMVGRHSHRERQGRLAALLHPGQAPGGMAADEAGHFFAGLTSG